MIIDAHTHIFPRHMRENRQPFCADKSFALIYGNPAAKMVGAEELIAAMDEAGVERSIVCGFPWGVPEFCSLHNAYLLEMGARYPERLIVFISLVLSDRDSSAWELERGIGSGAKGIGEVAFYDREMTSRDLDVMKPILGLMEQKEIPLLLHTNETLGHSYPGKGTTRLDRFYDMIVSFPRLIFLLAHWGGGLAFYELMPEVAKAMSNVYYDTAASPYIYSKRIYAIVSQMVGPDKVLFGTDYPLLPHRRYIQELRASGLAAEDQDKILGLNVARLLRLGIGANE